MDYECEKIVTSFLQARYGEVKFPINTNDLTILVEQYTTDLDQYADLSGEGNDVEGVTDFFPGRKPSVRLSSLLQEPRLENRLRSTLTHELGHVRFHDSLWPHYQLSLLSAYQQDHSPRCKRETIISTNQVDWMEWQAGYASGSLLMPITSLTYTVQLFLEQSKTFGPLLVDSRPGQQLMQLVQSGFQVSSAAARVRLLQLGHLSEQAIPTTLLPGF